MSDDVTSILVDEISSDMNFFFQNLRNYPWGNSRASGGVWGGVNALRFRYVIFENPEISENQRSALTSENQGTLGLYLALECKCAFGAIKEFPDTMYNYSRL